MSTRKISFTLIVISLLIGFFLGFGVQQKITHVISNEFEKEHPIVEDRFESIEIPENFQGNIPIFILAGQSNMSGRGEIGDFGLTIEENVYVFGNDYHWKLAFEPVDDPLNQVDQVSLDLEAGFGPALAFAKKLTDNHPVTYPTIGLIPCAKGASSIHEWRRSMDDNMLYGSCLKRIRAALLMGEVAGLLFFQGETDAIDPILFPEKTLLPETWAAEFEMFVEDWRKDLNDPDLPIVFAQIGSTTNPDRYINWEEIQRQQSSIQLQNVIMITTKDLPLMDDVHFTAESYQVIGERFAEAYLSLLQK